MTSCRYFHRKGEPAIQTTVKPITPSTSLHVAITAVRDFSLVLCSQPSFKSRHKPQISAPRSNISTHRLQNACESLFYLFRYFQYLNAHRQQIVPIESQITLSNNVQSGLVPNQKKKLCTLWSYRGTPFFICIF